MAGNVDGNNFPWRRKREADGGDGPVNPEPSRLESCLDPPLDSVLHEVVKHKPSPLAAKHYDSDTTEPISCGLGTLEELLSWKRSEANPFNVAAVQLAPRKPRLADSHLRTLVSHDMMGGYLDDRFIQGTAAETPYSFYHWQYIDIFNYFTHNLVTIPPAVWTNAAHKHGVLVIGTFITEWDEGAAACEVFLKGEESYRKVADKLVQISLCYGFEGWLINIENVLSEVAVKNTPLFLRYLTDQMHERIPGSQVIWYDSVINNGHLKWQNELNESNRMFFDACDGFFTNYNWTENSLVAMSEYSGTQGRQADVYIGVDVFGRSNVVGGMFETNKSLEIIRKYNFSTAIFAPGWVYETHQDKMEFRRNQDRFWGLLTDFLYLHRLTSAIPFISSFCQGFGKAIYWRGQREAESSWFNLSAQEIQPLYYHVELGDRGWLISRGCPEDAWNGGCSLLLEGLIPASQTFPICAKVFSLCVPLPSETMVSFIYKSSSGITVSLEFKMADANSGTDTDYLEEKLTTVSPVALEDGHHLVSQLPQLCGDPNPAGWTVSCLRLEPGGFTVREICVNIKRNGEPQDTQFNCRLGEIMLTDVASLQAPLQPLEGLCIYDVVWLRGNDPTSSHTLFFNATLRWDYPVELVRHFRVYWRQLRGPDPRYPAGRLLLLGRAYCNMFRVTEVAVLEPPGLLELVVEPVIRMSLPVPETQWGRRSLSYTEDNL